MLRLREYMHQTHKFLLPAMAGVLAYSMYTQGWREGLFLALLVIMIGTSVSYILMALLSYVDQRKVKSTEERASELYEEFAGIIAHVHPGCQRVVCSMIVVTIATLVEYDVIKDVRLAYQVVQPMTIFKERFPHTEDVLDGVNIDEHNSH